MISSPLQLQFQEVSEVLHSRISSSVAPEDVSSAASSSAGVSDETRGPCLVFTDQQVHMFQVSCILGSECVLRQYPYRLRF